MTTDVPNGRAILSQHRWKQLNGNSTCIQPQHFYPTRFHQFRVPGGSVSVHQLRCFDGGQTGSRLGTGAYVTFIKSDLISTSGVIPSPTPTPSPSPSPTPPYIPTFAKQINLPANDLAIVSSSGQIYASVPSSAGPTGNSVTRINPQTAAIGESVFIGSEPNRVALSDDGTTLHVSLDGAAAIRSYNIPTQTPGTQFTWGAVNNRPADMVVLPGSPLSLATAGGTGGVNIYDNGVARPSGSNGGAHGIGSIAFTLTFSDVRF